MNKRLKEIEQRIAAIKRELEGEGADIDALSTETDELLEERKNIMAQIETRKNILGAIASGNAGAGEPVVGEPEERSYGLDSAEYRSGFLKTIRKMTLTDVETRAMTTNASSAGSAVPTQTLNRIIEKVHEYAPVLEKIDLLSIKGSVKIPSEGTTIEAKLHAEAAEITGDDDTLSSVDLGTYEITKLVTISKSVETMSIDAFEKWLVKKIARKIAEKITGYILYGTGVGQPQGVDAIPWDETNSITVEASKTLTEDNIDELVALLPGGYDPYAEWYMSKKTFFKDFRPLQNKSKNDVVTKDGNTWYVAGYPVNFDERGKLHDAILGDLVNGYAGNMPEDVNIVSQFVARENAFDFLGTAIFDGKVSAIEAFVKLKKAS